MLLYGGGAFEGSFFLVAKNDLWQFDLTSDTWLQLPADPNAPSSRWAGIMAVDTALDELAVVGGQSFNTPLSDANAFALDSNHWIPLPAAPANLMNGSAFVDPFTHRLTVIGGIWMQSGVFAYEQTLPARPTLHLTGPDPAPWTAGSVVPLSFHAASQPAGNQIVDYAVSSNRAWPGLPFNGFVASNGNATIDIGIPVPDTAAGDAIIHVVARLRDDPAAADSADAILLDPSAVTTERLSLRNAGPDTLLLAPGSASNLRVLAQVAAAGPRTVEIVASGSAEVSGLPLTHSYVVLDSATISIPIAIPDSAVSSTVTVHVVARLASNAEAADSTDLHLRIQRAPASAVVMGSTTTLTEVRIRWQVSDRTSTFWIERRVGEGLWEALASVKPTSTGAVLLRDTEIRPGTHYEYGLTEGDPGNPILAPVAIDVPQVVFALHGAFPNPVNGEMAIHMDLLEGSPAQVDLFDISGRRVRSAKLASPLSGPQELRWPTSGLRPGVYVIRLAQSGRSISTRVTVMR
jgi:hypothetical protein